MKSLLPACPTYLKSERRARWNYRGYALGPVAVIRAHDKRRLWHGERSKDPTWVQGLKISSKMRYKLSTAAVLTHIKREKEVPR